MINIIICCTGGFARELYCWIKQSEIHQDIKFKGFLDIDEKLLVPFGLEKYYLGHEDKFVPKDRDFYLIAAGDVNIREVIYKKLKNKNYSFFNYIHESVIIGEEVKFGEGNIVCPNSVLTTNISINNRNIFNINCTIGHYVVIDSFSTFSSHCDITGHASVENNNFFGSRVTLLPKSKIGSNNKISAGSVIYKGIKNNCIYMGNPARKIGSNV